MPGRFRSGTALYAGVIAIAGLGVFWAGMSFRGGRKQQVTVTPSPLALALAMSQSGFGANELAAAGASAGSVEGTVSAARTALIQGQIDFAQLGLDVAAARQSAERLEATVQAGNGSQETLASLSSARAALASAESRLATARGTVRTAIASVLPQSTAAKIDTISATGTDLPIKYRVTGRTEAQAVALREALANQRIAAARGEPGLDACRQLVASAGSDAAVANADVAMATNGAEITTAWKQAVGIR
ncbi:MAG: hypothetical protein IT353_18105 [Gemmatimonadaceae bacterium]|nr:hypothetical protein [Gemmatimonadaceae bacterium]